MPDDHAELRGSDAGSWPLRAELALNRPIGPGASVHYEIRVAGHLDQHWSTWFCGMTLALEDDDTTILRGWVRDQAALHGLLATVRDIGVPLLSINATDP